MRERKTPLTPGRGIKGEGAALLHGDSSSPLFFYVAVIAAMFGVVWWFFTQHGDKGRDLWPALGFPYGPIGNLASVGASASAGNLSGVSASGGALPVTLTPAGIAPKLLTDHTGATLTDRAGTGLTDVQGTPTVPGLVPSYNSAGIKSNYNYSGSKPS